MPKIYSLKDYPQGKPAWLNLRVGKVTASEAEALLTPSFEPRKGQGVETYLCTKVAEKFRGQAFVIYTGEFCEEGHIRETEARARYEFANNCDTERVGFVDADDGRSGCSPDGLLGEDGGIEIKCPQATNHTRYLLAGKLPTDYIVQVHFSLYATGRKYWMFHSYRRNFPSFTIRVERDEAIMQKIKTALEAFYVQFDAAMEKMNQLNEKA